MIIPKRKRRRVPNDQPGAIVDVYAEQFAEEVEACAKIDLTTDDPKELRQLAKWCEKAAAYFEYLEA